VLWSTGARYEAWRWLSARWPDALDWDQETITAFFEDLEPYPPAQVMHALHNLRDQGREFAPRVSVVIAAVRALEDEPSRDRPALPPPPLPGQMSWAEYARRQFGEEISVREAARRYARGELPLEEE